MRLFPSTCVDSSHARQAKALPALAYPLVLASSLLLVSLVWTLADVELAFGGKFGRTLDDVVRATARVADDVPIRNAEEVAEKLVTSKAAQEAIEAELRKSGRFAETLDEAARAAARSGEVARLLRQATAHLDPSLLRRLEQLDNATREASVVLVRGSEQVGKTLPDIAARGRFLQEGGAETVAAIGLHGADAAHDALRVSEAIKGGNLAVRAGDRAVTLADFGAAMTRDGSKSWAFWQTYVRPHWKVWVASGALATYLANPEYFQDRLGVLTEEGFRRLTELAGEAAARAIAGVSSGAGNAATKIGTDLLRSFDHWKGGGALVGILVLLGIAGLAFRRTRYYLTRPLAWLNQHPQEGKSSD